MSTKQNKGLAGIVAAATFAMQTGCVGNPEKAVPCDERKVPYNILIEPTPSYNGSDDTIISALFSQVASNAYACPGDVIATINANATGFPTNDYTLTSTGQTYTDVSTVYDLFSATIPSTDLQQFTPFSDYNSTSNPTDISLPVDVFVSNFGGSVYTSSTTMTVGDNVLPTFVSTNYAITGTTTMTNSLASTFTLTTQVDDIGSQVDSAGVSLEINGNSYSLTESVTNVFGVSLDGTAFSAPSTEYILHVKDYAGNETTTTGEIDVTDIPALKINDLFVDPSTISNNQDIYAIAVQLSPSSRSYTLDQLTVSCSVGSIFLTNLNYDGSSFIGEFTVGDLSSNSLGTTAADYSIDCTVADLSLNTATDSRVVTVLDNRAPVGSCSIISGSNATNTYVNCQISDETSFPLDGESSSSGITVQIMDGTTYISLTPIAGTPDYWEGEIPTQGRLAAPQSVVLNATDAAGNILPITYNYNLTDGIAPIESCSVTPATVTNNMVTPLLFTLNASDETTIPTATYDAGIFGSGILPGSGIYSVSLTIPQGTAGGVYSVIGTASDGTNTSECIAQVTVSDVTAPVFMSDSVTPTSGNLGDSYAVTLVVTDETALPENGQITVTAGSDSAILSDPEADGTYEGTITPTSAGTFVLQYDNITDAAGNMASLATGSSIQVNYDGVAVSCSVSPDTIRNDVDTTLDAIVQLTGTTTAYVRSGTYEMSAIGASGALDCSGTDQCSAAVDVLSGIAAGTYMVSTQVVDDINGPIPCETTVTIEDYMRPTIDEITISPSTVYSGEAVTVSVYMADETLIDSGSAYVRFSNGVSSSAFYSLVDSDGGGIYSAVISENLPAGVYGIELGVSDMAQNTTAYNFTETTASLEVLASGASDTGVNNDSGNYDTGLPQDSGSIDTGYHSGGYDSTPTDTGYVDTGSYHSGDSTPTDTGVPTDSTPIDTGSYDSGDSTPTDSTPTDTGSYDSGDSTPTDSTPDTGSVPCTVATVALTRSGSSQLYNNGSEIDRAIAYTATIQEGDCGSINTSSLAVSLQNSTTGVSYGTLSLTSAGGNTYNTSSSLDAYTSGLSLGTYNASVTVATADGAHTQTTTDTFTLDTVCRNMRTDFASNATLALYVAGAPVTEAEDGNPAHAYLTTLIDPQDGPTITTVYLGGSSTYANVLFNYDATTYAINLGNCINMSGTSGGFIATPEGACSLGTTVDLTASNVLWDLSSTCVSAGSFVEAGVKSAANGSGPAYNLTSRTVILTDGNGTSAHPVNQAGSPKTICGMNQ